MIGAHDVLSRFHSLRHAALELNANLDDETVIVMSPGTYSEFIELVRGDLGYRYVSTLSLNARLYGMLVECDPDCNDMELRCPRH